MLGQYILLYIVLSTSTVLLANSRIADKNKIKKPEEKVKVLRPNFRNKPQRELGYNQKIRIAA